MTKRRGLSTKVQRVKERAAMRQAKRKAASLGQKLVPWGVAFAQSLVLLLIAMANGPLTELDVPGLALLRLYSVVGGIIVMAYAVREAGLIALFYSVAVWWVLMRDDCDPYIIGVFFNIWFAIALVMLTLSGQLPSL